MTITDHGTGLADQSADPASMLAWFRRMRDGRPVSHDEQAGVWHVFRYADAERILAEPATFSSDFSSLSKPQKDVDLFRRGNVLRKDPPQHRKMRTLVSKAFTPRTVAEMAPRIAAITNELLDAMAGAEEIELISDLAYPLPVIVITELLGIPWEDRQQFRKWADALVSPESQTGLIPNEKRTQTMAAVMREMNPYCLSHIRSRRAHPTDDLIGKLVTTEVDGQTLEDEEIVGFVSLLLLAGHITTTALLGNSVVSLDESPEATATLRADTSALPTAVDEVLRYRTPLAPITRRTTREVQLGDETIPAEKMVVIWLASANRDERQFADPDRFDVYRQPNAHLSFGHGIHFCVGAPLARFEAHIALEIMFRRWSTMVTLPGVEFHDPRGICGVKRLPLRVDWA
jgi:cytochrome P450